jgi:hypothetical protein
LNSFTNARKNSIKPVRMYLQRTLPKVWIIAAFILKRTISGLTRRRDGINKLNSESSKLSTKYKNYRTR